MSYRGFKRLLGETSLERKCRFLFGAATLLLISGSFLWYYWNTKDLAKEQVKSMGRVLIYHAVLKAHLDKVTPDQQSLVADLQGLGADLRHDLIPPELRFEAEVITRKNPDPDKLELLRDFADLGEEETETYLSGQRDTNYIYRGAVRAGDSCVQCHLKRDPDIAAGQLMGVANIKMSTRAMENRMHINQAVLISTALVSALLLTGGSYLIVRYVIVKPVKHLKEVSDAISAGELNIRSEIQTGDEFEDLSHAFNRMLRTLVSMQDQLRRVNSDLDRKVDELAQANMALYQTNQLKSDFLATMSHELRTPLNSVLGFSEVLLSSDQLNDKQKKWVRNIQTSGERLLSMINDVLDLAKIEAGKMQIRVEEFSIHDVCEGLLNMFRALAEKKNIDLEGEVDPGIPVLRQDANKLQQILWNLLSNAIKFTPEGGRVVLKTETDGVHLILSVIDTGVGIAAEDQELIFEKFRQSGSAITREHAGTGLGLSIVRELAKLLGGDVGLQSELGRGSTFTVTLPLHLKEEFHLNFDLAADKPPPLPVDARLFATSKAGGNGAER
jgi:signal transduction histidine kinase